MKQYITVEKLLQGRDVQYPIDALQRANAEELCRRVNGLLNEYVEDTGDTDLVAVVSSGYRPAAINAAIPHAAKKSAHLECKAVDLAAFNLKLTNWIWQFRDYTLNKYNLDLEHFGWTPGWIHLDSRHRSGDRNRVFIPDSTPQKRKEYNLKDPQG